MKMTDELKNKLDKAMSEMEDSLCNRIMNKSKKLKESEEENEDSEKDS